MRQEERGFSFSDPNVGVLHQFLALPHEALRHLPQRLRSQPHFGWKRCVRTFSVRSFRHRGPMFVRPPSGSAASSHGPEAEESAVTRVAF